MYTGAIPLKRNYNNEWLYGIYNANCTGFENQIWNCTYDEFVSSEYINCSGNIDAGVICQGKNI